jgi:hypothetical protein
MSSSTTLGIQRSCRDLGLVALNSLSSIEVASACEFNSQLSAENDKSTHQIRALCAALEESSKDRQARLTEVCDLKDRIESLEMDISCAYEAEACDLKDRIESLEMDISLFENCSKIEVDDLQSQLLCSQKHLAAAQSQLQDAMNHSLCTICMDNPVCSVVVPCGHMCGCNSCLQRILDGDDARCPICRIPIDHIMKVYRTGVANQSSSTGSDLLHHHPPNTPASSEQLLRRALGEAEATATATRVPNFLDVEATIAWQLEEFPTGREPPYLLGVPDEMAVIDAEARWTDHDHLILSPRQVVYQTLIVGHSWDDDPD